MPTVVEVVQSPQFRRDLADAWVYVAEDSEDRADALLDAVEETSRLVAENPGVGRPRPELEGGTMRSVLTAKRYLVYYRPAGEGRVELVRLFHTSRDPDSVL